MGESTIRIRFHYAEFFLLINTIIGILAPLLDPLNVSIRTLLGQDWFEMSVFVPLATMNFLVAFSWLFLAVISIPKFSKPHLERTVKLGLRKLIYFFLLVATLILFFPILVRALSPDPVLFFVFGSFLGWEESFRGGLIRPSAGVDVSVLYFFVILIANISVWSFGHLKELRTLSRQ